MPCAPTNNLNRSVDEGNQVIALMGVTGSGKSTFASLLSDNVSIGHGLRSGTAMAGFYGLRHHGSNRNVVPLDTSGFDDTTRPDAEILKEIAFVFAAIYKAGATLAGIIFPHRITDPRMSGGAIKNLEIFKRLCGDGGEAYPSVVLTTNMWPGLDAGHAGYVAAERREGELRGTRYWGPILDGGASLARHDGSEVSARRIVDSIIDRSAGRGIVLQIQRELVDQGMTLDATAAGPYLQGEIRAAEEEFAAELRELQEAMDEARREHDEAYDGRLKRRRHSLRRKSRSMRGTMRR